MKAIELKKYIKDEIKRVKPLFPENVTVQEVLKQLSYFIDRKFREDKYKKK